MGRRSKRAKNRHSAHLFDHLSRFHDRVKREALFDWDQCAARHRPIKSQSVWQSQQEATHGIFVIVVLAALTASFSIANAHEGAVYVAGKARYCKETAVSGYLDCFYVSLDVCEKHNKAANLRCVANPNSGT